ncbi:winged helix-turn-helix transcriptional regulator [Streptomyces sp. NPDC056361]|uniref:winged helix-turn-helix transcriptional regulator n=1 Tax=Streptomyces sp. NPDC056361 TaxID=3345795 RepID=UPI0035E0DD21
MNPRETPDWPAVIPIDSFDAQRIEDAFSLMGPKWTTSSVMTMPQEGRPLRVRDVAARLPFVSEQLVSKRLVTMHADGLVLRTGPRHGDSYVLTDASRELGPVYAIVEHWSASLAKQWTPSPPVPVSTAQRTHSGIPLGSDGARTVAALCRSAAVPNSLFSHAPQPQPRVPTVVTAQSAPGRSR